LIVAVCCWPSSVAVTVTVCALLTAPVVALNPPLLWPVAIVTLAGTVSAAAPLVIATIVAPVAAALSETVQLAEPFAPNVDGVQTSDPRETGPKAVRLKLCVLPL
jgi:hypothetical protein